MTQANDLKGMKFGSLTPTKRVVSDKRGKAAWECACDCGGSIVVRVDNLMYGRTTRCAACRTMPKRPPSRKPPTMDFGKRGEIFTMPGKPNLSEQIGISESVNTLSDDGDIWGG